MRTVTAPLSGLLRRICVQPPYFGLRDIHTDGPARLTCTAPIQTPPGAEAPIGMAEVARHSAIAGLCAAAADASDDRRRYYLARAGSVERLPGASRHCADHVTIEARAEFDTPRRVRAHGLVSIAGEVIFDVHVDYAVLTDEAFRRFFGHLRRPTHNHGIRGNPYTEIWEPDRMEIAGRSATAVATSAVSECAGHFPNYPAVPVARLLSADYHLGARLAARHLRGNAAMPVYSELTYARTLLPPENPVDLHASATPDTERAGRVMIDTTAWSAGEPTVRTATVYAVTDS